MGARLVDAGGGSGPNDGLPVRSAEEQALLDAARRGDARAFAALVRLHQDAIFALVRRMVSDRQTAEELTQDVFLRAWRSLAGFRGDARFGTWLHRIAVNLCADYRQSRAARQRRKETSFERNGSGRIAGLPPVPGPDEVRTEAEMGAMFEQCLHTLDGRYLAAFLLYHQQGLAMEEVARVLGISRTNAKVRVYRAREMILAALRERGFDV